MNIKWKNIIIVLLALFILYQRFDMKNWKDKYFAKQEEYLNQKELVKDYVDLLENRDYTIETLKENAVKLKETKQERRMIDIAASVYRIDKWLLEAIIMHETGNYTSYLYENKNNACGMRYANSYEFVSYINIEQSIIACAKNLKFNYLDMGYLSIKSIGSKYAPINDTTDTKGLNNHWVEAVTIIYNELKGGK